jgi:hypothetical protein
MAFLQTQRAAQLITACNADNVQELFGMCYLFVAGEEADMLPLRCVHLHFKIEKLKEL